MQTENKNSSMFNLKEKENIGHFLAYKSEGITHLCKSMVRKYGRR